ncbi:MAG TPA: FtsX-like permease family protein, partial [Oscillatoriaceae cyanobacterium]
MVSPNPLARMLARELWSMRGQAGAIAAVVAAGVAIFVMMLATFHSLDLTLRTYYSRYRMADVFAGALRAPEWLVPQLAAIPGVAQVDTRVEAEITLHVPGEQASLGAHLIAWPENGHPALDDVYLRRGHLPSADRPDDVLVSENFAKARGLRPGDTLEAVLDGHAHTLRICGTALTPEYLYAVPPGSLLPDDAHYGLVWMTRDAVASAFDMRGAFNRVAARLEPGTAAAPVLARVDQLLAPYGGTGSVPLAQQASNWIVQAKIEGLRSMGTVIPVVFLGVAAFLIDLVLSRLVGMQREQIAVLKALGYSDARVAWHYAQWGLAITGAGSLGGIGVGVLLGQALTRLYGTYFQFPVLVFELPFSVALGAVAVGVIAAAFGTWKAVRAVLALPPAEAMRPEAPAAYRVSVFERGALRRWLG